MNKISIIFISLIILSGILVVNASNTKTVTINSTVTVINIIPPPINETSISGYVINDVNKSGLSNWNIQLFGVTKDYKVINKMAATNSTGFYKFNNLSEGSYTLMIILKSGYIPIGATALQVNLKENQKSENNNFTVISIDDFIRRIIGTRNPNWWYHIRR